MTTAEQIKAARAARGHSQADAAREIGCSVDGLRKWEQGTREPVGLYAQAVQHYIATATAEVEGD